MDTNRPTVPASQLNISDALSVAEDGVGVIGDLLSWISGIAHSIGHVNHPLLIDKIAEALSHLEGFSKTIKEAKSLGVPPTPNAADTP